METKIFLIPLAEHLAKLRAKKNLHSNARDIVSMSARMLSLI